jgi:putative transposase
MAAVIEGLALERPRRSVAAIHRVVRDSTAWNGAPVPSYATVHSSVRAMDPALMVLAHEGPKAYAHAYDLLHRREASRPNEIWQADHTELDILVLDEAGSVVRPWLTIVIDDHSRAIAAYRISTGAPSALQTALALRNAIWRKSEAGWTICGMPNSSRRNSMTPRYELWQINGSATITCRSHALVTVNWKSTPSSGVSDKKTSSSAAQALCTCW